MASSPAISPPESNTRVSPKLHFLIPTPTQPSCQWKTQPPTSSQHQGWISTNELGNGNQMPDVARHPLWPSLRSWQDGPHPPAPSHSGGGGEVMRGVGREQQVFFLVGGAKQSTEGCGFKFIQIWWPHQDIIAWSLPSPPFYLCQRCQCPCGN